VSGTCFSHISICRYVFIGGDFTAIGARPFAQIAFFDGGQWQPLGSSSDQSLGGLYYGMWYPPVVFDLEVNSTSCYVGGRFVRAGATPVRDSFLSSRNPFKLVV